MQVGDKVEIAVTLGSESTSFSSEILELLEGNRILIEEIKHENQSVGFTGASEINFIHMGEKLNIWKYVTVKLVRYKNQIYHCVTITGSSAPFNRRETFRLFLGVDCQLLFATAQGIETRDILLKDISEGGFGFLLNEELPINKKVRIQLSDNGFQLDLRASVIRCIPLEEKSTNLYGCQLVHPEPQLGKYIRFKQGAKLQQMRS